jgi:parvulin-like peptidyl-prolyl isomerase
MSSMRVAALLFSAALATAGGCNPFAREEARPLTADAFVSQRVEGRANPEPIDQPGQVIVGGVTPPPEKESSRAGAPSANAAGNNGISPAVRQAVGGNGSAPGGRTPTSAGAAGTTTRPAPAPGRNATAARPTTGASDPSGQYVIFGTVLARVNDRPIYAHKVLALLDSALRAEAQRYDERQFRPVAAELINKEVDKQIREEVVFTIAEKSLDAHEREWAKALTQQWQNEEQTKAGGSLELAKRKWQEDGWDFAERVDHQYRASMTLVYLQRRVYPLINVTATDVRRYYDANKATEFTHPAQAKFRVIKIDPRALKLAGGAEEARRIAEDLHAKAAQPDAVFEALARGEYNDPTLRASGGLLPGNEDGFNPKGTYVVEQVENAAWALEPGQVTDVIEFRGAFYLAKLEAKRDAIAEEFENIGLQERIREKLKGLQLMDFQEQRQAEMQKNAVWQKHPQMMQIALDMAMQRYPQWRAGK